MYIIFIIIVLFFYLYVKDMEKKLYIKIRIYKKHN